jgi:uncharacterized protein YqeY
MIRAKIEQDLIIARRARESQRLLVLQMLISALNYEQIRLQVELNENQERKVLRREARKRAEAAEIYEKADRKDQAGAERFELKVIKSYLPEQMGEREIKTIIRKNAKKTRLSGGALVGAVMKEIKGRADGGVVARLVNEIDVEKK